MSCSSSSQTQPSIGTSTELFKLDCSTAVIIMEYNDSRKVKFLRYGGFVVNLIISSSSIMMITCTVDGLQWPISKDAPVIRVGQRRFAFGMPGLLYGLQFPPSCEEENINTIERLFMKFSHYQCLDLRDLTGDPWKDDDPALWRMLRPRIEIIVHNVLSQFGHHPGKSPFAIGNQDVNVMRVLRTSATTKMVGNAILSGSLKPNHIEIQDMRTLKQESDGKSASSDITFASISVFTNLIEAVEVFWVIASGKSHLLKEKITNLKELVGFKMWRLNRMGLAAFLKTLDVKK